MAASATGGHKFPEGRHNLRLGDSFFSKAAPSFHTMRYDFKPASVGDCKETYVEVAENQEVTVTVPKLDDTSEVRDATIFKGPRKPYQKECLLIYDHETGEFVLEQLTYNIQLKKTRGEVTEEVLQNIRETRKKLTHSAGDAADVAMDTFPSSAMATSGDVGNGGVGAGGDAELMSESDGSGSETDSSDEGEEHDDAHSDVMVNGDAADFNDDEIEKTLLSELSSAHDTRDDTDAMDSGVGVSRNNFDSAPNQDAGPAATSRLQEDLLLSESSDDDDD